MISTVKGDGFQKSPDVGAPSEFLEGDPLHVSARCHSCWASSSRVARRYETKEKDLGKKELKGL